MSSWSLQGRKCVHRWICNYLTTTQRVDRVNEGPQRSRDDILDIIVCQNRLLGNVCGFLSSDCLAQSFFLIGKRWIVARYQMWTVPKSSFLEVLNALDDKARQTTCSTHETVPQSRCFLLCGYVGARSGMDAAGCPRKSVLVPLAQMEYDIFPFLAIGQVCTYHQFVDDAHNQWWWLLENDDW